MQLTPFDHWLRKSFLYEMHIRTLRPAPHVPPRVKTLDLPESPTNRYRHLYIARRSDDADALIKALREAGQMFNSEVAERRGWHLRILCPAHHSFTWSMISFFLFAASFVAAGFGVLAILRKPIIQDAMGDLQKLLQ
jgi:hypothetical protein